MNNYIVAVPDAGVVAVLLFVPVLCLDIALGADTGGGGGRGLVTGGRALVIGGGSGHVTGGRRGRGGPITGGGRGAGDRGTALSPVPTVLSQGTLK